MAAPQKKAAPAAEAPKQAEPAAELADGASSSDPAVHQLLAHRYTATQNGDRAAYDAVTAELAKLGYR